MRLAGTGHRPNRFLNEYDYDGPVTKAVQDECVAWLKKLKPTLVISGMAQGFDTILALCALSEGIPLEAALPFEGQEAKWSKDSQGLYRWILSRPGVKTTLVSPGSPGRGFGWLYQIRNQYMVDNADVVLACWDGSDGGTANCVRYAQGINKPVHVMSEWIVARKAG